MHFKDPINILHMKQILLFSKSNEIYRGKQSTGLLQGKALRQLYPLLPLTLAAEPSHVESGGLAQP